jgi:hypothetical protein
VSQYYGTFYFEFDGSGWSETYFLVGGDQAAAVANMEAIWLKRKTISPALVTLTGAKVSVTGKPRDSFVIQDLAGSHGTFVQEAPGNVVPTWVALLFRMNVASGPPGSKFIRGLPPECIAGMQFVPTPAMVTALGDYATALAANARVRQVDRTAVPATTSYVAVTSGSQVRLTERRVGRPFGQPVGRRRPG